jgi:hypothetical protein
MMMTREEASRLDALASDSSLWDSPEHIREVLEEVYIAGKNARPIYNQMVVVSRKWDNPTINVEYKEEGIALSMDATEFVSSIASHCQHPMKTWIRKVQKKQMIAAKDAVVEEMKMATAMNPPPMR